jgi:hypothetical protein
MSAPLPKLEPSHESEEPDAGFDSYQSLAYPDIRIIVANNAVPPFRFKAGGWELLVSSTEVGSAIRACIGERGYFLFRVNEDQSGGVELHDFPRSTDQIVDGPAPPPKINPNPPDTQPATPNGVSPDHSIDDG